ncbi:hypothetical protein LMG29542_05902 [Paraburkholderia humisilvae]|uniref:Uncharacterized protein n=1 Tax=Paraburkholderia humisilvae TaxID=627669 RepID=A0A6J5ETP9_9BURK|nr:hypothetical protein LMG29542_05902 [Paraburkholderia humisilvae]
MPAAGNMCRSPMIVAILGRGASEPAFRQTLQLMKQEPYSGSTA